MRMVKLGEILTESKIESTNPDPDRRITVKLFLKGIEKRPHEAGVEGATKYFTRKAGQFIYGKQNLFKGAFGIIPKELDGFDSSSDIPAFDVREDCLPEWLYYFLKQGDFYKTLESIATGTGSRRIQPSRLFEIEMPLPDIHEQKKIIRESINSEEKFNVLFKEFQQQVHLISKLRESILQDAIYGKLSRQSENRENAIALLQKIKNEKIELGLKEKELPTIKENEVPFKLPTGWLWCRLGDICVKIGSGSTPRGGRAVYKSEGIKFLRSQNVYNDGLFFDNVAYIDKTTHSKMSATKVLPNDILLNITGGSIGRSALVPEDFDEANVSQHVTIIRLANGLQNKFIHNIILSPYFQDKIMEVQTGGNREGLAKKNMELMLIPLPPLSEQKDIVAKVDELMQLCNGLEKEIVNSQQFVKKLMQNILKEAFRKN